MPRLALLTVLLAATAAVANMPPPRPECSRDDECTLTQWSGCCGTCCPQDAYPVAKEELRRRQNVCAAVDCAARECPATPCAPGNDGRDSVAVCRLGRCAKLSREDLPPPPPPRPAHFCASNADCVVSTFACCGGCCEPAPQALTRSELAQRQSSCARKKCRAPSDCGRVRCAQPPPASSFEAVCRANRCQLVPASTGPDAAECREDIDCMVTYPRPPASAACHRSPCGCCPGTEAVAVPRSTSLVREPSPPEQNAPPFGLSTGDTAGTPPQQQVRCEPCRTPPPARAVCRAGRCEAQSIRHFRK